MSHGDGFNKTRLVQYSGFVGVIYDKGIAVNSALTLSANALTATNTARGILNSIIRLFACLTKTIFEPIYRALVRPHLVYTIQAN